jgi:hypothetical protein
MLVGMCASILLITAALISGLLLDPAPIKASELDSSTQSMRIRSQAKIGVSLASGTPGIDLTLQNQRILCWGTSYTQGEPALHGQGEAYPEHLGRILGRDVDMHPTMAGSDGFLEEVGMLEEGEYGIIIVQSSWDFLLGVSWDITEANTREVIRRLKATGAVVVFWEDDPVWDIDGQITTTKDWSVKRKACYSSPIPSTTTASRMTARPRQ